MKHSDHISPFLLEFDALSSVLDWNDSALSHALYSALPLRITREMDDYTFPSTSEGVRAFARRIDHRFWQQQERCESEVQHPPPDVSDSSDGASEYYSEDTRKSSVDDSEFSELSGSSFGGDSQNNSSSTSSATTFSTFSVLSVPSGSSVPVSVPASVSSGPVNVRTVHPASVRKLLDRKGKLRAEERKRQVHHNLCNYCGGSGHKVSVCKKRPTAPSTSGNSSAAGTSSTLES
jgi:hypothetical protein